MRGAGSFNTHSTQQTPEHTIEESLPHCEGGGGGERRRRRRRREREREREGVCACE